MRRYFAGDISANFSIDLSSLPGQGIYTIPQLWYYRAVLNENGNGGNWLNAGGKVPSGENNGSGNGSGNGNNSPKTFDDLAPFNSSYSAVGGPSYVDPNSELKNGTGLGYHIEWGDYGLIDSFNTYNGSLSTSTIYGGALSNTVSFYRVKPNNIIDYFGNCDKKAEDVLTTITVDLFDEDNPCSVSFYVSLLLIDSSDIENDVKYVYHVKVLLHDLNIPITNPLPDNNENRITLLNSIIKNSFKIPAQQFIITTTKPTTRAELLSLITTKTISHNIIYNGFGIVSGLAINYGEHIVKDLRLQNNAYTKNVVKDNYYYLNVISGGSNELFYDFSYNCNITINTMSSVYYNCFIQEQPMNSSGITVLGDVEKVFPLLKTDDFINFTLDDTDYSYTPDVIENNYIAGASIISDVVNNSDINLKNSNNLAEFINVYGDSNHINKYEISNNNLEDYTGLGNINLSSSVSFIKKHGSTYYGVYRIYKQGYSPSVNSIINVEKYFIVKSVDLTNWEILVEFPDGFSSFSIGDRFLNVVNKIPDSYPILIYWSYTNNKLLVVNSETLVVGVVNIVNDLVVSKVPEYNSYYTKSATPKLYYDDAYKSILMIITVQYKEYSYSSLAEKQVFYRII